jgi:hypothetical protein
MELGQGMSNPEWQWNRTGIEHAGRDCNGKEFQRFTRMEGEVDEEDEGTGISARYPRG